MSGRSVLPCVLMYSRCLFSVLPFFSLAITDNINQMSALEISLL